jgi:hypothetical protein
MISVVRVSYPYGIKFDTSSSSAGKPRRALSPIRSLC